MATAVGARRRVYGLSKPNALRPEASEWLGRMHLELDDDDNPLISARQLTAYGRWQQTVVNYLWAIDRSRERSAPDLNRTSKVYDNRQGDERGQGACRHGLGASSRPKVIAG